MSEEEHADEWIIHRAIKEGFELLCITLMAIRHAEMLNDIVVDKHLERAKGMINKIKK